MEHPSVLIHLFFSNRIGFEFSLQRNDLSVPNTVLDPAAVISCLHSGLLSFLLANCLRCAPSPFRLALLRRRLLLRHWELFTLILPVDAPLGDFAAAGQLRFEAGRADVHLSVHQIRPDQPAGFIQCTIMSPNGKGKQGKSEVKPSKSERK